MHYIKNNDFARHEKNSDRISNSELIFHGILYKLETENQWGINQLY